MMGGGERDGGGDDKDEGDGSRPYAFRSAGIPQRVQYCDIPQRVQYCDIHNTIE